MTAESIALTIAVKYCGSGEGSQPGRDEGRQGGVVAEPTAPLFTPSFTKRNIAAGRGVGKCILAAYSLGFA